MIKAKSHAKKTVFHENIWVTFDKDIHKKVDEYKEQFAQEGHSVEVQTTCIAWPYTITCPNRYLYRVVVDLIPDV